MNKKLKIEFDSTVIKSFLLDIKRLIKIGYKELIILMFLVLSCFVSSSLLEGNSKNARFESFYNQLTQEITNTGDGLTLKISAKENGDNKNLRDCAIKYNFLDRAYPQYSTNLAIFQNDGLLQSIEQDKNKSLSLLCPRTYTIINNDDKLILESMKFNMLFNRYPGTYDDHEWCYISNEYADYLLTQKKLNNYNELLGTNINIVYSRNGVKLNGSLTILSIFDINNGAAPYYKKLFDGDFILSSLPLYNQIDSANLIVNFSSSIMKNRNLLNMVETHIGEKVNSFEFTFYSITSENSNSNDYINNIYYNYLIFKENSLINILCYFILIIGMLLSFFMVFRIASNKIISIPFKSSFLFFVVCLFLLFIISYFTLNLINVLYTQSNSTTIWLSVIVFILTALMLSNILQKNITKGEMENENSNLDSK